MRLKLKIKAINFFIFLLKKVLTSMNVIYIITLDLERRLNMKRNFASVKIEEETYITLKDVKYKQGIPMTESIRIAVLEKYGKKNSK